MLTGVGSHSYGKINKPQQVAVKLRNSPINTSQDGRRRTTDTTSRLRGSCFLVAKFLNLYGLKSDLYLCWLESTEYQYSGRMLWSKVVGLGK